MINIKGFGKVNHVGIVVADLDKAIQFYSALTGKEINPKENIGSERLAALQGIKDSQLRCATVYLDNINIDLLEYIAPAPSYAKYERTQISGMHLCFEIGDINSALARLNELGIKPSGKPITFTAEDQLTGGIGTTVVFFEDPDGTHLELIDPKGTFKRA